MEQIINYIYPELLILVPVLYLIGAGFKKSELVQDKQIPLLLGVLGIVLSLLYIFSVQVGTPCANRLTAVFTAITQGVLCAGASVYVNQVIKQSGKEE